MFILKSIVVGLGSLVAFSGGDWAQAANKAARPNLGAFGQQFFSPPALEKPLTDYCPVPHVLTCPQGFFWKVEQACPDDMEVVAVSCMTNNFNYSLKLLENARSPSGKMGVCVWGLKHKPDVTTLGTISIICKK